MGKGRRQVIAALSETLFPALYDDARLARDGGDEPLANFLCTSGSSLDFFVSEVSVPPLLHPWCSDYRRSNNEARLVCGCPTFTTLAKSESALLDADTYITMYQSLLSTRLSH